MPLIIAIPTKSIKWTRIFCMPANMNGAEHNHKARVREIPSSNLGTHIEDYTASPKGQPYAEFISRWHNFDDSLGSNLGQTGYGRALLELCPS
jgi:hypothetical protein